MGTSSILQFLQRNRLDLPLPLVLEALSHPSYQAMDPSQPNYEQLETLGDAVLDLLVTEDLLDSDPGLQPGELTQQRSRLVKNRTLAKVARHLDIGSLVLTSSDYHLNSRDLANVIEALLGAVFRYGGYSAAKRWYKQLRDQLYLNAPKLDNLNPIGRLQEYTQKYQLPLPQYILRREGPDHQPCYTAEVSLQLTEGTISACGKGGSKQESREQAASLLLSKLVSLD